jgi:gluconate 2-dehydrogenase gamma chain
MTAAGGSLAMLFASPSLSSEKKAKMQNSKMSNTWQVIDVVQQHLFPVEDNSPGAREINALTYLQFIVTDDTLDTDSREFITQGAMWLEGMADQLYKKSFVELKSDSREKVLKRIASSKAGENWLSTLLLYITEALLSDPAYGGNPNQLGWKWLQHIPGYPRPPVDKTFPNLLS